MTNRITNPTRLKHAALSVASVIALSTAAAMTPASAQANDTREMSVEAMPLDDAINAISNQTGVQIVVRNSDARGIDARPIEGTYTAEEALQLVLADTGLEYRWVNDRTIAVGTPRRFDQTTEMTGGALRTNEVVDTQSTPPSEPPAGDDNQDDEAMIADTIVVTGTNIRGQRDNGTPVISYDRDDIVNSGAFTVEEFLRTVPQNFGSTTATSSVGGNPFDEGNAGIAATSIDLRGLGAGSTLVLLNGRRLAPTGLGAFVDVSSIPLSVIDRVDVVTDGASAIYGSDAVAGVVNFITAPEFSGFEARASYGAVTDGDFDTTQLGATAGRQWVSGSLVLNAEYTNQSELTASDRDFVNLSLTSPDTTLSPDTETLSLFGTLRQELSPRLVFNTSLLFSDREALSVIFDDAESVRSEAQSLVLHSSLEYALSDDITLSGYFDYARQETDQSQSDDGFRETSSLNNELMSIELQAQGRAFYLPSGDVLFAVGAAYRNEQFERIDDDVDFSPDRDIVSGYGEVVIPIIGEDQDVTLIQDLKVTLAARYEDIEGVGETFDPKASISWQVVPSLRLRGSYSESFRSPSLFDLFTAPRITVQPFPVSFLMQSAPPPQDPRLPDGFASVLFTGGGNPDLQEERAETFTIGFDVEPVEIQGLRFGATYYETVYDDRVTFINAINILQNPLFTDFLLVNPDPDFVDTLLERGRSGNAVFNNLGLPFDPTGSDIQVVTLVGDQNASEFVVSGIDLYADYRFDTSVGAFSTNLNASYITEYSIALSDLDNLSDQSNLIYRPIDLSLRAGLAWESGPFNVASAMNYHNDYEDNVGNSIDAWITADLRFSYDLGESPFSDVLGDGTFSLAVQNVFDEDPPFVETLDGLNFDTANANATGRFISIGFTKQF